MNIAYNISWTLYNLYHCGTINKVLGLKWIYIYIYITRYTHKKKWNKFAVHRLVLTNVVCNVVASTFRKIRWRSYGLRVTIVAKDKRGLKWINYHLVNVWIHIIRQLDEFQIKRKQTWSERELGLSLSLSLSLSILN